MNDGISFYPPRKTGNLIHISVSLLLLLLIAWLFIQATRVELGLPFLFYLLSSALLAVPLIVLLYRLYSLNRAAYVLQRDGVILQWGLRLEAIPLTNLLWVRSAESLEQPLTPPRLSWLGSILGRVRHEELGEVEFLASEAEGFILVGTEKRVYAITPEENEAFLRAARDQFERGSLSPMQARSVHPAFLMGQVWGSREARILLITALALSLVLLIGVGIAVSSRPTLSLGFSPNGTPQAPVASVQLFLLPIIQVFIFLGNYLLALYFYRRLKTHPMTYLLWGSSVLTALFLLGALFSILRVA